MKNEKLPLVPVSIGELIDKITILRIKKDRLVETTKLENVNKELHLLENAKDKFLLHDVVFIKKIKELENDLKKLNEDIWDMGDVIRECAHKKNFGGGFIKVAIGIHHANDKRAEIKRKINLILKSPIVEEKSYYDQK